jgi:beta-lactamase class A
MKKTLAILPFLFLSSVPPIAVASEDGIVEAARQVEARLGARVGLVVLDTDNGRIWRHRADERFPMASTFKVLACGALLARVDAGQEELDRPVRIEQADIVTYSPVTEGSVGREMSLRALCEATMRTSDNSAANKVLDALGGPDAVTGFMRALGDRTTRLDRRETDLNQATPGDPRDTTSPEAIAASLQTLVLGDALAAPSRDLLIEWLVGNAVGGPLLRAGIPGDWRIGDRTGAGGHGTRGVVAVLWPPERAPVVAVVYITETTASMDERNAAIAEIGRAVTATLSNTR